MNCFVGLDLETTGLDINQHVIIQAAIIVVDQDLNPVSKDICLDIWQPEEKLKNMTPFVRDMHTKTGLLKRSEQSKISIIDAEKILLKEITKHCTYQPMLIGNSISFDIKFIEKFMPGLHSFLHYRSIDVSSIAELSKVWYNKEYIKSTDNLHDALFDIKQSLEQLRFLRKEIFK